MGLTSKWLGEVFKGASEALYWTHSAGQQKSLEALLLNVSCITLFRALKRLSFPNHHRLLRI
ncbi:hypothetical protein C8R46DRAFT_1210338 [Mycena filopes]|nr:hypothetical protein C8R46DRAFT_1210338 [Mycena filopes]